jgi:hypothetical protein
MDFKGTKMEVIEKKSAPGVTRTRGTRIRNDDGRFSKKS